MEKIIKKNRNDCFSVFFCVIMTRSYSRELICRKGQVGGAERQVNDVILNPA